MNDVEITPLIDPKTGFSHSWGVVFKGKLAKRHKPRIFKSMDSLTYFMIQTIGCDVVGDIVDHYLV